MILSQCLPWLLLPPFLAATAVHVPLNHHIRRDAEVQTDTMNFGGVWVPAPQWSVYSGLIDNFEMTTLSEVQFYGCSDSQKIQLRNAHTAAVQTAGQLYNLLNAYDPTDSMNVTTIAMLNYFFRGQLKDNPASIDYVRNVFKVISRGVSIHPNQPLTFSPIRFICVQPDVTYGWTALGLRDAAAIPVNQFFWWFVSPNDRAPCKWSVVKGLFMSPLDCQSVFIMHEMAHLAGVQLYPEAYFVKDLLAMKPLDSVHNAQTYAFAGLVHRTNCSSNYVKPKPQKSHPHMEEMRRFKQITAPQIPDVDSTNDTGLSDVGDNAGFGMVTEVWGSEIPNLGPDNAPVPRVWGS